MKARVISAIVMLSVTAACSFLSPVSRALFLCAVGILAIYEMNHTVKKLRLGFPTILPMCYLVLHTVFCFFEVPARAEIVLFGSVFLIMLCVCIVKPNYRARGAIGGSFAMLYPTLLFAMIIWILLQEDWLQTAATGCLGTWFCDAFAMFGGKFLGKRKLSPEVSPNKTMEGTICGAVASLVGGLLAWFLLKDSTSLALIPALLTSLVASSMGQFGDLAASLFKREVKIKDYSKLIPGHGGVMDRVDSLLFAIPTAWVCLHLAEIF